MDRAYVDANANQAICCWNAPDRASVEALLVRAQVKPESIREVVEFGAQEKVPSALRHQLEVLLTNESV